jgi:hypothetical protein
MRAGVRAGAAAAAFLAVISASPGFAECPVELAVYDDARGVAELDFTPAPATEGDEISNSFRLLLDNDVVLDGTVRWEGRESRPIAKLFHKCPEGEPTAEELAACTMWQGVIYSADEKGTIGLLPKQGQPAPHKLVLPALGPTLRLSTAYGLEGFSETPWDVFTLKTCQE